MEKPLPRTPSEGIKNSRLNLGGYFTICTKFAPYN